MNIRKIYTSQNDTAPLFARWEAGWRPLDEGILQDRGYGANEAAAVADLVNSYELPEENNA